MYNNQNYSKTQFIVNMLERERTLFIEKQSALTAQKTIDEKIFFINRLIDYFSFSYLDTTLFDLFAEAIILIHTSGKSLIENENAQSIFHIMFSHSDANFHNRFKGIDGHDIEILFRNTELTEDFCIIYDIQEVVERVYPAIKKYVIFSKNSSLAERVSLIRIAFLLNQFLYDRRIQKILNTQKNDFKKLKEKFEIVVKQKAVTLKQSNQ